MALQSITDPYQSRVRRAG